MNASTHKVARLPRGRLGAALLALGLIGALVLPAAAFAGKGGGKGAGATTAATLNLVVLDGGDAANHGDRVTFAASQSATDRPFVGVRCYQGAEWVLDAYVGLFDGYMFDQWVTLDSAYWSAGVDATCTARLFYYDRRGNQKVLATNTFPALP